MHLSIQNHCGLPVSAKGFTLQNLTAQSEVTSAMRRNWAPAAFLDGYRDLEHFVSTDCLCFDVDNTDPATACSIEDFTRAWAGTRFVLATSKSHGIEKICGKGANARTCAPADRYHVIFPLREAMTDAAMVRDALKNIAAAFPYFDKAATDAARFFFGHAQAQCFFNNTGDYLDPLKYLHIAPAPLALANIAHGGPTGFEEYREEPAHESIRSDPAARAQLLSALKASAASGAFNDRAEWVKLALALKSFDYSIGDFISLSWPGAEDEACKVWASAKPSRVSGGTLVHYARMSTPTLFTPGTAAPDRALTAYRERAASVQAMIAETPKAIEPSTIARPKEEYVYSTLMGPLCEIDNFPTFALTRTGAIVKTAILLREISLRDHDIATCVRYDEGTSEIIYNPIFRTIDELKNQLQFRFSEYGIEITKDERTLIIDEIIRRPKNTFNSILDYFHEVASEAPAECPLPELLDYFRFQEFGNDDPMICPEKNEEILTAYKETFHQFFLRQAGRIHLTFETRRRAIPHDIVPIFRGRQGIGKSRFCQWIAGEPQFYRDFGSTSIQIGDANLIRKMAGRLIGELGELSSLKKGDVDIVKAFISEINDEYTPKYKEGIKKITRTCAFVGSTNSGKFLKDKTGNRRFYPIWVHSIDSDLFENTDLVRKIWGYYYNLAVSHVKQGTMDAFFTIPGRGIYDDIRSQSVDHGVTGVLVAKAIHEIEATRLAGRKLNQKLLNVTMLEIVEKIDNKLLRDYTNQTIEALLSDYGYVSKVIWQGKSVRGYAIALDDKRLLARHGRAAIASGEKTDNNYDEDVEDAFPG